MSRRRALVTAPAVVLLLAAATPPAELTLDDLPPVTPELVAASVHRYDPEKIRYRVTDYSERYLRIQPLATEVTDGGETVVTLATDILFAVDDATLSDAARTELGTLVADLPDGAAVSVEGHTDSVGSDEHNQGLSDRRAAAVADALRAARPDLALTVTGYGETRPAVEESGDAVADARAQNRRVELRHTTVTAGASAAPVPTPEPVRSAPPRTGTTPHALPLPADVGTTHEVRIPADEPAGAEIVVGVEELVVRGAVTQLSLVVHLDGVPDDVDDVPWLLDALGGVSTERDWDPVLVDREGMLRYGAVRVSQHIDEWEGEGDLIGTKLGRERRFTLTYPRLLGGARVVDVPLGSTLPTLVDVPVEVEQ